VLRNECSNQVLEVGAGSQSDGANVNQYTYAGYNQQRWIITATDSGYFKVIAKHSGKALEVGGAGATAGSNVNQYTYAGYNQQQWKFTEIAGKPGYYKINPRHAQSLMLDNYGATSNAGANVVVYTDDGTCAEHWTLEPYWTLAQYTGPVQIKDAGVAGGLQATYTDSQNVRHFTGNWQSLSPSTPAVQIMTAQPVVIENSYIASQSDLVTAVGVDNSNVTLFNNHGYALNPNVSGQMNGRFLIAYKAAKVAATNNFLYGTTGMVIRGGNASGTITPQSISISYNRARNIDGRRSDGNNGYTTVSDSNIFASQFIQLDKINNASNVEISWNEVINDPFKSASGDVISFYLSSGTASSPVLVHDNYIQGSYPPDPVNQDFSGGGILLGDGLPSNANEAAPGFLKGYNNQVVGTDNYGVGIVSGHDSQAYGNRVVSSGRLPDGRPIKHNNVGVQFYKINSNDNFVNNDVHDNTSAWLQNSGYGSGTFVSNPYFFDRSYCANGCVNNTTLSTNPTLQDEINEFQMWQSKMTQNNVSVGIH